jgi:putative chitinase
VLAEVSGCPPGTAAEYAPLLNSAASACELTTLEGKALFVAQVAHECDRFRTLVEYADGSAYNGRGDLGNTQPGDGPRYKGRGFIQITGRANYRDAGAALGLPLLDSPQLAEDPQNAARILTWYWTTRKITPPADAGRLSEVTQIINGGQNGAADRGELYRKAQTALKKPAA